MTRAPVSPRRPEAITLVPLGAGGAHRHGVALVERLAGEAGVVVRNAGRVGEAEVLVLQGVLDLVSEREAQALAGGRVLADDELLAERIVERGGLLVEDGGEHA